MSLDTPTILSAAGTGVQAYGALRSGRSDAAALRGQAGAVQDQAGRDEEATRRQSRQRLGELAASMAETGGGQDLGLLRQSAINAELDALNVRYGGGMRAAGLLAEAGAVKSRSKLLAGSAILSGASSIYKQKNT